MSETWQKLAELVVLAETTATHDRLQGQLRDWARAKGFTVDYNDLSGLKPDVLCGDATKRLVFVGDAKVSSHEGPNTMATCVRLGRYFDAFADLLRSKQQSGGILAVATDAADMAHAWIPRLETLATKAGLSSIGKISPSFRVDDIGGGCWVTWW